MLGCTPNNRPASIGFPEYQLSSADGPTVLKRIQKIKMLSGNLPMINAFEAGRSCNESTSSQACCVLACFEGNKLPSFISTSKANSDVFLS